MEMKPSGTISILNNNSQGLYVGNKPYRKTVIINMRNIIRKEKIKQIYNVLHLL